MKTYAHVSDAEGRSGVSQGVCICPLCGYRIKRPPAVPCYALHCPRCEAQMVPG